ncbi:MAG: arylsulfatase A-like enzyme [Polaribacter sp.]|jgi:arylsulfatase A-like enzyme
MKFIKALLILFVFSSITNCTTRAQESKKPNIIVILTDDQGYGDVGFNGSKQIKTPNIDKLAKNGAVFTNGYVSYAVCGPSRAGLITGRYQDQFGYSRNPLFGPKDASLGLPLEEETLAEALKKAGYTNMAIGKWHLGAYATLRPLKRGFDEFYGFLSGGHKYFPEQLIRKDLSEVGSQFDAYNTKLLRNDTRVEETEYLTDAFSREAVNFVDKNAKKPFFLYLAYNAPHAPLQATEKYLSRYPNIKNKDRKTYAAMVSAVDDGVGLLLQKLKDLNIDKNTIVFFLSDNGGNENKGSFNGPLKKGKGSLFEGGIRVPFAVQWEGTILPNQKFEHPIISLDIFATAVAQAKVTPKNKIDGKNLIPYLSGKNNEAPHETLYWRMYDKKSVAVRKHNYKYIIEKGGEVGLYNLANDISEKNNLKDSLKIKELKSLYEIWNKNNINPIFYGLGDNKEYNQKNPKRFKNVEKY